VQKSVFEGVLNEAPLVELWYRVRVIIDLDADRLRIYRLREPRAPSQAGDGQETTVRHQGAAGAVTRTLRAPVPLGRSVQGSRHGQDRPLAH